MKKKQINIHIDKLIENYHYDGKNQINEKEKHLIVMF